jgi:lipoprotein-anchoring transpeptidase ErfK/SrfK
VQEALARSRQGNIISRTWRGVTGETIDASIQPRVSFGRAPVTQLVRRITKRLSYPAKDASVSFTGDSVGAIAGHYGRTVQSHRLEQDILAALRTRSGSRFVTVHTAKVKPKVTTAELAQKYPTVITVDRSAFQLRLWKNLHLVKTYGIAVGRAGLETPAGLYHIQDKQVNPSWHVPNSPWAGSLAGQVIPPGPADPIKARWMGIYNGAGIHGTEETGSIGSAASHGCIRMLIPDVIELYDQTPLGAPVYIA